MTINHQSSIALVNNNDKQEIYVWGDNAYGQLGLGDTNNKSIPTLLDSSKLGNYLSIIDISLLNSVGKAIVNTLDGVQIYVWGYNTSGQLGIGNAANQSSPILFDTTQFGDIQYTDIKELKIAAEDSIIGSEVSYAIIGDKLKADKIFVWGKNNLCQLGLGDNSNRNTPTLFDTKPFGLYKNIKKFVVTSWHSVAIIEYLDNTLGVYLWGSNKYSQSTAGPASTYIASPKKLTLIVDNIGQIHNLNGSEIKDAGVGLDASYMILTRNGIDVLYLWGYSTDGQMGVVNSSGYQPYPKPIEPSLLGNPTEILSVNISKYPYAVVKISGVNQVYVWGINTNGTPGVGQPTSAAQITPTRFDMSLIGNPLEIYDSSFNYPNKYNTNRFASVRTATGNKLYMWGENANGQSGNNQVTPYLITPVNVNTVGDISSSIIKKYSNSRFNNSFILEKNGIDTIYATGYNNGGQLGIGNTAQQITFTPILPTRYTNPKPKIMPTANLTSSQTLELINPNNTLNRIELDKYVDTTSFPAGATLSIDPATTTSDYKNGILNLGIRTNQYNDLLIVSTVSTPKTFNVTIPGFRPVTDVNTNPVSVIIRDADGNNIDKIYDQLVDSTYKVINRDLLEYYFDLSSIPPNAVIHLYRTSFGNDTEATFTLTASQVYGNNGLIVSNQLYVKTDLVWTFTSSQLNLALVISLSVVGGLLLIGAIIAIMLVRRSSNRLII